MNLPHGCATLCIGAMLVCHLTTYVKMSPAAFDNTINNLYDALLQREYAGPVIFPNHQVERKAQRSPSLRLRFGRRSDPSLQSLMPLEKRWFGEVNQKPIRSPSLRLRFGRRSDPSMPLHTPLDDYLNNHYKNINDKKGNHNDNMKIEGNLSSDEEFERVVRKPQRLRWGRSLPFTHHANNINPNTNINTANELETLQGGRDIMDELLNSARVRNLLANVRQYEANALDENDNAETYAANDINENENDNETDNENDNKKIYDDMDYQRDVKKNISPMRLRFGRSIGQPLTNPTTTTTTAVADKNSTKTGMK